MRILILHNAYAQPGGEDAVVAAEAEALRARGHEVQLCVRDSAALHASPVRGIVETLFTVANVDASRELARVLERVRPELVHVHNLFPRWGLAALRTLAQYDLPVVQTLHNFRWLCAPATRLREGRDCDLCAQGDFSSALRFACMKHSRAVSAAYALALATNRATGLAEQVVTRFICVSEFVRDLHLRAGFPAQKLLVKGHFLSDAPAPAGAGDGSVIYVGRLSPEKGLSVLLRALRLMPEVTLKIAGDGPERAALERELGELGPRVHFLGRLSRPALWQALAQSSVCVVPSLGSETFGLAVLEAFACARPVVASDAGGLPELVRDGQNGWLVPRDDSEALADRVRRLLADPALAQNFGRAGRALVEASYLPEANMKQLELIYEQARAQHRASCALI